ncbi:serine/threonine-protein kinase [Mycobacterium gordonae]|uniref:non-specific serine/threonine protein kinase n=1 Tax=Mycobacterium gordonae TaxID=1778 RepID=A0A1X1X8G5_MYCGO|nr:serine/threonine-protein kinase [Mycobacterium gordonae]MCQ4365342.1 serine/threonine protein kinase [Mycobacterium gordonae]MCV7005621.1 serine/threonine protein kinase [Mycobacterium gordonae]ODR23534.1 protein kinase [Mycobacterium gordonae]ORV95195.1 protein kinase [Mycobacterium gordonae]
MSSARGSRVGTRFGPYFLKRQLGVGGMGEVYEAVDTVRQRVVALKLLSERLSHDPVFRMRMQREARNAGRLQEPHVVPIHDYGEIDGQLYLDMRLIEGTHLALLLERFGPVTPPWAVALVHQVASALDAAHAAGVLHRDVKPENILVTQDDFVYLVDFGIASAATDEKLTQIGTAVGTWRYMAPERFSDAEVSHRADIYSLTCVLHECLTGTPPYRADSAGMLITAHLMAPIPRPSQLRPGIPPAFDAVIARGMAKRPEERYASAGELAEAAHQALSAPHQAQEFRILKRSEASGPQQHTAVEAATASVSLPLAPEAGPDPESLTAHRAVDVPERVILPKGLTALTAQVETPAPPAEPPAPPAEPVAAPQPAPEPRPSRPPSPLRARLRNPWVLIGALALVVLLVLAAQGIRLSLRPNPAAAPKTTTVAPTPSSSTPPTGSADAMARLLSLLPLGYAPGACRPFLPPKDALARVICDKNIDPGGPNRAVFTVFGETETLRQFFDGLLRTDIMVNCPGEAKSPTDWHHADSPQIGGRAFCAVQDSSPSLAWTNEAQLMIALVQGDPQGPSLEELDAWWKKHR